MNSGQLNSVMRQDTHVSPLAAPVMPRDIFVKNARRLSSKKSECIINTDKAGLLGQHWIALHFSGRGRCDYFDSYGFPPLHEDIINILRLCNVKVFYNSCTFQGVSTDVCGEYCLLFVFLRCRGFTMRRIQKRLATIRNTDERDHIFHENFVNVRNRTRVTNKLPFRQIHLQNSRSLYHS